MNPSRLQVHRALTEIERLAENAEYMQMPDVMPPSYIESRLLLIIGLCGLLTTALVGIAYYLFA